MGNTVHSNSFADALSGSLGFPQMVSGLVWMVLVVLLLLGGVRRIVDVAVN